MDELLLCEVRVNENNLDCDDSKFGDISQKSTLCDNANRGELNMSEIGTGTAVPGERIKTGKEGDPDDVFSHKEDFRFGKADLNTSNTDSLCSEMEHKSVDKEGLRKRTRSETASANSRVFPKKRYENYTDAVPGTSAKLSSRHKKAPLQKSPSSSTSEDSQGNPNESDFGLQDSEDSSGAYGSLDVYRFDEEDSGPSMAKRGVFPNTDELLYCVDCKCAWEGDCPDHGPLNVVDDTVIFKNGKHEHCIDATDTDTSNWMRFVQRTEDDTRRNLDAFQYRGQIYFRSIRAISPGDELLVSNNTSRGLFTQYLRNVSFVTERHGQDDDCEDLPELPSCTQFSDDDFSRLTSEEYSLELSGSKNKQLGKTGRRKRRTRRRDTEASPNVITKISYVCSSCSAAFANKRDPKTDSNQTLQGHNGEGRFSGAESNGRFSSVKLENAHLGDGDQRFSNSNFKKGMQEELLICSECNQVFGKKVTLNVVTQPHVEEMSQDCENRLGQDDKSSDGDKSRSEVRSRTQSDQKRPNVCPVCSEQFIGKRPLNKHMRTHINQKPYVCPECNQGFARKFTLNMHIRTHTREKPYECPECNKCFAISVNLRTHMKIHAGVKPYVCPECNRSFARKSHLDGHMQIHNGEKTFVCPVCDHRFFHKHNLIKHLRTHSKEQPFGCPECHERFAYKSHFKKHLRIHTGGMAWTGPIVKDQQGEQT